MSLLDADRWTPAKLEKLIAGLPWTNGTLPLSVLEAINIAVSVAGKQLVRAWFLGNTEANWWACCA